MILAEFSKFLQQYNEDLMTNKKHSLELLHIWIEEVLGRVPKRNYEKIIHKELLYAKNSAGDYVIIGKSDSGRKLVTSLINYCASYENFIRAKWLEMTEQKFHTQD